eukprot:6191205-Pleurochrysis_carterae.AAC.7
MMQPTHDEQRHTRKWHICLAAPVHATYLKHFSYEHIKMLCPDDYKRMAASLVHDYLLRTLLVNGMVVHTNHHHSKKPTAPGVLFSSNKSKSKSLSTIGYKLCRTKRTSGTKRHSGSAKVIASYACYAHGCCRFERPRDSCAAKTSPTKMLSAISGVPRCKKKPLVDALAFWAGRCIE